MSNLLSIISACTALIATIIGPYIAVKTARSQITATVISSNRAKWIESMRDLVAGAISHWTGVLYLRATVHERDAATIGTNEALLERIENGMLTNTKIRLMLNPSEADGKQLMKALDALVASLGSSADQAIVQVEVHGHLNEIVRITQAILKAEWIRVKVGS